MLCYTPSCFSTAAYVSSRSEPAVTAASLYLRAFDSKAGREMTGNCVLTAAPLGGSMKLSAIIFAVMVDNNLSHHRGYTHTTHYDQFVPGHRHTDVLPLIMQEAEETETHSQPPSCPTALKQQENP